ncbi:shikimate dehydrogenase [Aliagarivorans marinus]|uniref:shikimate dehydrogenase n=1 Tax=Aliagarivorans marinus TaxID=561965 RepID=UPI000401E090|nr:shikimate dehydrogenase [Aliagarivorans marinus]
MDRYAVFGNPVTHSKSPFIHTLFARQTQQQLEYSAIEAPVDGFEQALSEFLENGGKGCNITAPFKEEAYRMAQQHSERAKLARAVNTLKLTDDGVLFGDTTDGAGLVSDLQSQFGSLEGKRILLLGAGGAARGAIQSLLECGPESLTIANRTVSKAEQLAEIFAPFGAVKACGFAEAQDDYQLIINSTSAGFSGQLPAISPELIKADTWVYDMMYANQTTPFNAWAKQQGAKQVVDGLGMLVGQAAESFAIWRGIRPGARQVLRELRRNLSA